MIHHCQEEVHLNFARAAEMCLDVEFYVGAISGGIFHLDNRVYDYQWERVELPVAHYFSEADNIKAAEVWTAIHVDGSTKSPKFVLESDNVALALLEHRLIDYSSNYTALFNRNSPVIIYAGEFDEDSGPITQ